MFGMRDDLSFFAKSRSRESEAISVFREVSESGIIDNLNFSLSFGVGSRRRSQIFAKSLSRESETISVFPKSRNQESETISIFR